MPKQIEIHSARPTLYSLDEGRTWSESRINELYRRQQWRGSQQALLAMNPERRQFHQVIQSLAVGLSDRFLFQVGDFVQWPADATGANEKIPSPRHRPKATLQERSIEYP